MKLIKLRENVLVNPDKISVIEFMEIQGERNLVVTVDSQQYVATVEPKELMQDLVSSGMESGNKVWQMWVG
jgi:hypothetical protein